MEHYMAEFGQGFVQAAVLSENNAVKYKLSISGSCTKSTVKPYIKLQDVEIGPQKYEPGMNVVVYNADQQVKIDIKSYNFTREPSAVNRAFMTYMDSLQPGLLVILVSNGKLQTCIELMEWFKKRNSLAWIEYKDTTKFDAAYSAFYLTSMKSISSEHVLYNDGKKVEPVNPHLDIVFDYYADIGVTGVPKRIAHIDTIIESNGVSELELARLPTSELITPIADYNLSAGDMMYFKFQMKTGIGSGTGDIPNGATRCNIRWFSGNDMISFTTISNSLDYTDRWQTFERYLTVPSGVDGFTIYFARQDAEDYGAIRNVVIVETSREEWPMFRPAEFGVNGIRMNTMVDGQNSELLILSDSGTDDRGIVRSAEFREKY